MKNLSIMFASILFIVFATSAAMAGGQHVVPKSDVIKVKSDTTRVRVVAQPLKHRITRLKRLTRFKRLVRFKRMTRFRRLER